MKKREKLAACFLITDIIAIIFFIIVICVGFFTPYETNTDDMKITRYHVSYKINSDRSINVTESIDMKYEEDYRVLFRDINYENEYDKESGFEFISLSATKNGQTETFLKGDKGNEDYQIGYSWDNDKDELNEPIECADKNSKCASIFFRNVHYLSPETNFVFEYKLTNMVSLYTDGALMSFRLIPFAKIQMKNITMDFYLDDDAEINFNNCTPVIQKTDYGYTAHISRLLANQNVDVCLKMNNQFFTGSVNNYPLTLEVFNGFTEREKVAINNRKYGLDSLAIGCAYLFLTILLFIYFYRKYDKEYTPSYHAKFCYELPSDLEPVIVEYLMKNEVVTDKGIYATLYRLREKGVISIDSIKKEDADDSETDELLKGKEAQIVLNETDVILNPYEKILVDHLKKISNDNIITIKKLKDYRENNLIEEINFNKEFIAEARSSGKKYGFFEDIKISYIALIFSIIGILFASLFVVLGFIMDPFFFLSGAFIAIPLLSFEVYANCFHRKTKKGIEEYAKWNSFKAYLEKYLKEEKNNLDKDYYSYALCFDVEDQYLEILKGLSPNENQFMGVFLFASFHQHYETSISSGSHGTSGSFSGGGGFRGR